MRMSQLKKNISKLKLKPTSNYIKSIKTFVISYTKRTEENIRTKNVLDSKKFWKTMRPFLSFKNTVFSQISIEKNNRIISDDSDLSEKFGNYFEDADGLLNVKPDENYLSDEEHLSDSVEVTIRKFENHSNIQAINQNISVNQGVYFSNTEVRDKLKEITTLNHKKNDTLVISQQNV